MTVLHVDNDPMCNDGYRGATVYTWDFLLRRLSVGLTGPPIDLHLVRHAESVVNAKGLITGQTDAELSLRGYFQAARLGIRLPLL